MHAHTHSLRCFFLFSFVVEAAVIVMSSYSISNPSIVSAPETSLSLSSSSSSPESIIASYVWFFSDPYRDWRLIRRVHLTFITSLMPPWKVRPMKRHEPRTRFIMTEDNSMYTISENKPVYDAYVILL
jgi:hypothetical protein